MAVSITAVDAPENGVGVRAPNQKKNDRLLSQSARRIQERTETKPHESSPTNRDHSSRRSVGTMSLVIDETDDRRIATSDNRTSREQERSFDDFMGLAAPIGSEPIGDTPLKTIQLESDQAVQLSGDQAANTKSSTSNLGPISTAAGIDDGSELLSYRAGGGTNADRYRQVQPDEREANWRLTNIAEAPTDSEENRQPHSPLAGKISIATNATHFSPVRELNTLLSGSAAADHSGLSIAQPKAVDHSGKTLMPLEGRNAPVIPAQIAAELSNDPSGNDGNAKQQERERPRETANSMRQESPKSPLLAAWKALTASAQENSAGQNAIFLPASQQLSRDVLAALPTVNSDEHGLPNETSAKVTGAGRMLRMLDITLEPVNLGAVQVRLELRDGTLNLSVVADRAATALILDNEQDALCRRLAEAGYDDATVTISGGQIDQQTTRDSTVMQDGRPTGSQGNGSSFSFGSDQPNASSNSKPDARLGSAIVDDQSTQLVDSEKQTRQSQADELYI